MNPGCCLISFAVNFCTLRYFLREGFFTKSWKAFFDKAGCTLRLHQYINLETLVDYLPEKLLIGILKSCELIQWGMVMSKFSCFRTGVC